MKGGSQNRDRILTEKVVRACWHEWEDEPIRRLRYESQFCKRCGGVKGTVGYIDFSTWKGFGELWEQLRQRKYWPEFWKWLTQKYLWEEWESKSPSQRADVVFEFWKEIGEVLDKG